ncbi:MAG TPA: hypothetical protein VFV99_04725, partial [Kofleriaceae bacterium]|nr:hypothetical protein [Kofleriaceae bacterium]
RVRMVARDGGGVGTIAEDQPLVFDLAADDKNLYFVTAYSDVYRIKQVSRFGGPVHMLACGHHQGQALYLTVAGDYVYWSDSFSLQRIEKFDPTFR